MGLGGRRNRSARKCRRKPPKIRNDPLSQRPQPPAVVAHSRFDEVHGHHCENEQSEKQLAGAAPREQPLKPRTNQPLQSHVEQQEQRRDQQHRGQYSWLRRRHAECHGSKPANRCHRGKIRQAVGQANDVKRGEIQRKTEHRAKFEAGPEPRSKNGKQLPEQENGPEQQSKPAEAAFRKKRIGTGEESDTQPHHEKSAENSEKDQAEKVETTGLLAQAVAKNAPAEPGNRPNLHQYSDGAGYISHESSSKRGRSVPS